LSWQTLHLSDVLADAKSGFACGEDPQDGVFQFRMNNVTIEGTLDLSKKRRVPKATRNLDAFLVEPGDVLFNATNSPELVGKSAFFPGHQEPAVFSNHFLRLRPHAGQLDGRFLARWLTLQFQRRTFEGMCRQWVNQATVGRDSLLALEIPLPPLAEQRRIAEVLDRAEALRAKRRAALAQLDPLTQALFLDLFGDPATNTKGVPIESLGNHLLFITSGGRGWAEFYAPTGSRFIRSLDVRINYIGNDDIAFVVPPDNAEARRTRTIAGDVLLTITGSRIGRVAPVPVELEGAYVSQHVAILRANHQRIGPEFLSFFLSFDTGGQRQIAKAQYGQTKPGLNFEQIRRFQIPVPPLPLQLDFARRIAAVQKLKTAHRASLAELDALFAALQHRAFRGEL
jgi:type I restriction enzyme S subunit